MPSDRFIKFVCISMSSLHMYYHYQHWIIYFQSTCIIIINCYRYKMTWCVESLFISSSIFLYVLQCEFTDFNDDDNLLIEVFSENIFRPNGQLCYLHRYIDLTIVCITYSYY